MKITDIQIIANERLAGPPRDAAHINKSLGTIQDHNTA
jgi:hypothetical protein